MTLSEEEVQVYCPVLAADAAEIAEVETCALCLDHLVPQDDIFVRVRKFIDCQHIFHANCIFDWLTQSDGSCPLCYKREEVTCVFAQNA